MEIVSDGGEDAIHIESEEIGASIQVVSGRCYTSGAESESVGAGPYKYLNT